MEEQEKIYENQRHTHAIAEIVYKDSCYQLVIYYHIHEHNHDDGHHHHKEGDG